MIFFFQATEFIVRGASDAAAAAITIAGVGATCANNWISIDGMSKVLQYTPPNSEIICGQNVGKKVVCGMILFFEKKAMLKI